MKKAPANAGAFLKRLHGGQQRLAAGFAGVFLLNRLHGGQLLLSAQTPGIDLLNCLHGGQPEIFDTPSFVFRMLHQLPRQNLRFGGHFPTTLFQKIFPDNFFVNPEEWA